MATTISRTGEPYDLLAFAKDVPLTYSESQALEKINQVFVDEINSAIRLKREIDNIDNKAD